MNRYNPTHRQLVDRAGYWLSTSKGCSVTLLERSSNKGGEEPDAIGWKQTRSILIEIKVSRSDFLADRKKPHRQKGEGMGANKYYMCPRGLIQPEEVPESWGLLWATEHQIRTVKRPDHESLSTAILHREMGMLVSAIRHIRVGCILVPDNGDTEPKKVVR